MNKLDDIAQLIRYPSHARMWMAPIRTGLVDQKMSDYKGAMEDWYGFVSETKTYYGVDMSVLTNSFTGEQRKYYLQVGVTSYIFIYSIFEEFEWFFYH